MSRYKKEPYEILNKSWEEFKENLKSIKSYLSKVRYDGYVKNSHKSASEMGKYPDYSFAVDRHPVLNNLYTLPQETRFKDWAELIEPLSPPDFPVLMDQPKLQLATFEYPGWYQQYIDRDVAERNLLINESITLKHEIDKRKFEFEELHRSLTSQKDSLKRAIELGDTSANEELIRIANRTHPLPEFFHLEFDVSIDVEKSVVVVEFEFPDYTNEKLVVGYKKVRYEDVPKYATETFKKKAIKNCLYSLVIRAAYLTAIYCQKNNYQLVVVNVRQNWFDLATGQPRSGVIASLQSPVDSLKSLDLEKLDPEACFKALKGLSTPSLQNINPIRPIFVLNKSDDRLVPSKDVDSYIEPEANLAAMEWDDFEHLVAQLFEWEFAKQGVEVRVTRASRDRGVDAILYDPDPLRGGKFVLQAKRYTRTVDVSAVRDLYGTVMNEGANRGILITTAGFGPDAYEFAKDKPISLVDGPNLVAMLQKHGRKYRIDLEEARRMAGDLSISQENRP